MTSNPNPLLVGLKLPLDGVELIIIIIGSFGQALAGEAHAVNIIAVIVLWRFIVGFTFLQP